MSPVAIQARQLNSASTLDKAAASAYNKQLLAWYETRKVTPASIRPKQQLVDFLRQNLHKLNPPVFTPGKAPTSAPHYTLAPFGSVVTRLGGAHSDVDLVLQDPAFPNGFPSGVAPRTDGIYNLNRVTKWLRTLPGITVKQTVKGAKVPIVKASARMGNGIVVEFDVSINQRLGIYNSRLINAYCNLHPLTKPLILAIKHWARARGFNDPGRQSGAVSFSSYTLTLMVIAFLQQITLLPNLQHHQLLEDAQVPESFFWLSRGGEPPISTKWDCRFVDDPSRFPPPKVNPTYLELVEGFYSWLDELDLKTQAIDIASGGLSPKTGVPYSENWSKGDWIVVDPLQRDRDTSKNLKPLVITQFRDEVKRALEMVRRGEEWERVCEVRSWDWGRMAFEQRKAKKKRRKQKGEKVVEGAEEQGEEGQEEEEVGVEEELEELTLEGREES